MLLLLDLLLLLLLLLLLYVFNHVLTREPSCNARNKMKLQERTTSKKQLGGTFESIVLRDSTVQGDLK